MIFKLGVKPTDFSKQDEFSRALSDEVCSLLRGLENIAINGVSEEAKDLFDEKTLNEIRGMDFSDLQVSLHNKLDTYFLLVE